MKWSYNKQAYLTEVEADQAGGGPPRLVLSYDGVSCLKINSLADSGIFGPPLSNNIWGPFAIHVHEAEWLEKDYRLMGGAPHVSRQPWRLPRTHGGVSRCSESPRPRGCNASLHARA